MISWLVTAALAGETWGTPALAVRSYAELGNLVEGDAVAIAAGGDHTCVISACGGIHCWGNDSRGQVSQAPTVGGFEQITAGDEHSCALTTAGKAICWGSNLDGQSTPPPDSRYRRIAAGKDFTCGVKTDWRIECWGDRPANIPSGMFGRLGAGDGHVCASTQGGAGVECFGDNSSGQSSVPAEPSTLGLSAEHIAGGYEYTCMIASDQLFCWGDDSDGQISGVGGSSPGAATENPDYPGLWEMPGDEWRDVDGGEHHTCAISTDFGSDTAYCWGASPYGEADPPAGEFNAIATGINHSCAIDIDGRVACWGDNAFDQLEVPTIEPLCVMPKWKLRWNFLVLDE